MNGDHKERNSEISDRSKENIQLNKENKKD